MSLQHLHLHVRDRSTSERFYESWFGMRVRQHGSEISFMTDEREFLLALMHDDAPAVMPPWFHFGFRLQSAAQVQGLHERMVQSGIAIHKPIYQDPTLVSYRCADPDDYLIEVYWEGEGAYT